MTESKAKSTHPRGTALILRAVEFAAWKHRDQRRKGRDGLPYVNHPIALANVLWFEGQVRDPVVIAAALLHDTIEDTETSPEELAGAFGAAVAEVVGEVTDVKWVGRAVRKKLQVARAAKSSRRARLVKLADKICNLRDIIANPPTDWSLARRREYFDWARSVVERVRGTNARLERKFDQVYGRRP